MVDEKHDGCIRRYMCSGSSHICVLCYANFTTCKTNLGSFSIERKVSETRNLANYIALNPDNLSAKNLAKVAKGVSGLLLSYNEPMDKLIDANHSDINMGSFFKKLIVQVALDVDQREATENVSSELADRM